MAHSLHPPYESYRWVGSKSHRVRQQEENLQVFFLDSNYLEHFSSEHYKRNRTEIDWQETDFLSLKAGLTSNSFYSVRMQQGDNGYAFALHIMFLLYFTCHQWKDNPRMIHLQELRGLWSKDGPAKGTISERVTYHSKRRQNQKHTVRKFPVFCPSARA